MSAETTEPQPIVFNIPDSWDNVERGKMPLETALKLPQWKASRELIDKVGDHVEAVASVSRPEDEAMTQAIIYLLKKILDQDKRASIVDDLNRVTKTEDDKFSWNFTDFNEIRLGYGLSSEQFNDIYRNWFYRRIGIPLDPTIPPERIKNISDDSVRFPDLQREKKDRRVAYLYAFANVTIEKDFLGLIDTLELRAVYDGGINDIACPLHGLKIGISGLDPIVTDFEKQLRLWRVNELNEEVGRHPEIITYLKGKFADIVRLYADNQEGFINSRKRMRRYDEPEINTSLYDDFYRFIIETYLPSKLDSKAKALFKLEYGSRHKARSGIQLRVLSEALTEKDTHHELYTGWHSKNHPDRVKTILDTISRGLNRLGFTDEADLKGLQKKLLIDGNFEKQLISLWDEAGKLCHRDKGWIGYNNLERWEDLYLFDYENDLLARYLRMVREGK